MQLQAPQHFTSEASVQPKARAGTTGSSCIGVMQLQLPNIWLVKQVSSPKLVQGIHRRAVLYPALRTCAHGERRACLATATQRLQTIKIHAEDITPEAFDPFGQVPAGLHESYLAPGPAAQVTAA